MFFRGPAVFVIAFGLLSACGGKTDRDFAGSGTGEPTGSGGSGGGVVDGLGGSGGTQSEGGSGGQVVDGSAGSEGGESVDAGRDGDSPATVDADVEDHGEQQVERSVQDVLENADTLVDHELIVVGRVFEDIRSKLSSWPPPALSSLVLQDGGDIPAYGASGSSGISYVQLFSSSVDLSPYLHQDVRVVAHLRRIEIEYLYDGGTTGPFLYLDVVSITET